jgi:hypothetical protein
MFKNHIYDYDRAINIILLLVIILITCKQLINFINLIQSIFWYSCTPTVMALIGPTAVHGIPFGLVQTVYAIGKALSAMKAIM